MPRPTRLLLPLALAATVAFGGESASLASLIADEIDARVWTPAPLPDPPAFAPLLPDTGEPVPFSIAVRDFTALPSPAAHAGRIIRPPSLPCIPERLEKSGETFLAYAGSISSPPSSDLPPLEWQLFSDTGSGGVRDYRFQITAPDDTERFLEIDFVLGDPAAPPLPEGRHSAGWRYHGFTPIPYPDFRPRLVFDPDPAEPRDLEPLYADGSTPCGFRARVAITPATAKFPRSAAFAFTATPVSPGVPFDCLALCTNLPHAPGRLPVPQDILDGDLSGVPVFPPSADAGVKLHPDDTVTIALSPPPLSLSIANGPAYALEIVRAVDALPAPPPAVLLRLDTLNPQASYDSPDILLVSDFPATWSGFPWTGRPVVLHTHAAASVVATLRRHLHERGIPLLVTLPPNAPYLAWHADAVLPPTHLP